MTESSIPRAMVLAAPRRPLQIAARARAEPMAGQVLIAVKACGVCRTDLHIVDGELAWPAHPVVPGHEVVGVVLEVGAGVVGFVPGERRVVSVANLTRRDAVEFLALAPKVPVHTTVETFPLAHANEALARLREGKINGAAVLIP